MVMERMSDRFGSSYSVSDLLRWSEEEYSTLRFSEHFKSSLPVLCRISAGYSGRDEDPHTLGQDEMFWIFEIYTQPRVTLVDEYGRQMSVPLDYRHRFDLLDSPDKPGECKSSQRLIDLVDRLDPGSTQLMIEDNKRVSFGLGADRKEMAALGPCRFKERKDVDFLIGYPLVEEFLHPVPVLLPTYVPAELRVALGFLYGTTSEFTKFTGELKKAVQRFAKLPAEICNDVLVFGEDQSSSDSDSLYLNPRKSFEDLDECDENPTSGPQRHPRGDASSSAAVDSAEPHPQRPTSAKPVVLRRSSCFKKEKPFPLPPMPRPLPQIETVPEKEVVIRYFRHYDTGGKGGKVSAAPPIPPRRSPTGPDSPFNHRRRKRGSDIQEELGDAAAEVDSLIPVQPPPAPPLPGWTPPGPPRLLPSERHGAADKETGGSTEMGQEATVAESIGRRRRLWRNAAEIPLYVSGFTIDELCYCLRALNLERYAEKFVENHVDGELLCSLNESILRWTFDFSDFDAIKLMKFARDGWRPRLGTNPASQPQ